LQLGIDGKIPEEISYTRFVSERTHIERKNGFPVRKDRRVQAEDARFSDTQRFGVGANHMGSRFPYKPLDRSRNEVRLLTILPPRERFRNTASSLDFCSEPIQCILEHVSLDEIRSDLDTPPRPRPPRPSSGPTQRPLPPSYLDGDPDHEGLQVERLMELVTRTATCGWMS